jgi:hypothetical protein
VAAKTGVELRRRLTLGVSMTGVLVTDGVSVGVGV